MPTYEVNEIQQGTSSASIDGRRYTRVFQVISDEVVHPALAGARIPVEVGDAFPYDTLSRCTNISSQLDQPEDSRVIYSVTASYETRSGGGEDVEESENPLDDIPVKRWGYRTTRLPIRAARKIRFMNQANVLKTVEAAANAEVGIPILNSAGEPLDPHPEDDFKSFYFEYQVNTLDFNLERANAYRGAINSDAVSIGGLAIQPFQGFISEFGASNAERNGVRYWAQTIRVEIADDWRLQAPDEGLRKGSGIIGPDNPKYTGNGEFLDVEPILDAQGIPITTPVMLDGFGNVLPDGSDPVMLVISTVAKPELPFKTIGLPTDHNP